MSEDETNAPENADSSVDEGQPSRTAEENGSREGWLEKLALHRPELRAWALYDWANSALVTVVITAVYPIFFEGVACEGAAQGVAASRHAYVTAASLLAIALMAPLLGAYADRARAKKRSLAFFMLAGAAATAALFFVGQGDWKFAAACFFLANVGASGSFVFYDALLPHVASGGPRETDRLSTSGFALGYLSGGFVLAVCLLLLQKPELVGLEAFDLQLRTRGTFVLVALWWILFSIPLFLRVSEPPGAEDDAERGSLGPRRILETARELFAYRNAFWLLVAFLFYNDAINTIIRMATLVGSELELETSAMMLAILLVQFVGIPFTFLFGALAGRFGTKRMVLFGLAVY
ncbi:MAG: MFS transporter, partial [Planctomycetota bacterium]